VWTSVDSARLPERKGAGVALFSPYREPHWVGGRSSSWVIGWRGPTPTAGGLAPPACGAPSLPTVRREPATCCSLAEGSEGHVQRLGAGMGRAPLVGEGGHDVSLARGELFVPLLFGTGEHAQASTTPHVAAVGGLKLSEDDLFAWGK